MVALNVVGRFRHQNDLHSYRRRLANEVEQDFALRLLPELISLRSRAGRYSPPAFSKLE